MKVFPILAAILFMASTCKEPTPPQATECDAGYLPCEGDRSQCCEVTCDDGFHNCGETLTDCCIDSTSHNFMWTIDTLGIYGSYLNDVAIVNENNIWVVGNIETDSGTYNAAHWNGEEWELIRIQPQGYVQPLGSIFYFAEDNIWFSLSTLPVHWDGESYYLYTPANDNYPGGSIINEIWASSPSDIYFVGSGGGIVHYDGVNFFQMDSGTDVDLKDVAGTPDGEYVVATGWGDMLESVVIALINGQWDTIYEDTQYAPTDSTFGTARAVSVHGETAYVTTMKGLWKYHLPTGESELMEWDYSSMNYFDFKVMDVYSPADILLTGTGFTITHYNGASFYQDYQFINLFDCVYVKGIDYDGQTAAVAGSLCWQHGIVIRGGRF